MLLRGADTPRAEELLQDARLATPAPQTVSAGLVARRPGEGAEELVARADALLYRAKGAGRDRVCSDAGSSTSAGTREAAGPPAPTAS